MKQRYAVTGAYGFSGKYIAKKLLKKGHEVITLTNSVSRENPFEKKVDRAQINCAVCDFNIKDGLAKSDIIMVDDAEKTILSAGTVNLKTEALDFGIQTKPKEGLGTKETGKVSVSLGAITKPFKLGGTLANPSLGISPERAVKTLSKMFAYYEFTRSGQGMHIQE